MNESLFIQRYVRNGDREALRELLGQYEDGLFGYLWQMLKHRQDSEDALQETFRKAIEALPRYREESHFKSWLFRIGHNTALDVIRLRRRTTELPDGICEELESGLHDPDESAMARERVEEVREAISTLPEHERAVVTLRLQEDMSFKEIAQVMGTPLGTVLARMHKAKERLRFQLKLV